MKHRKEMKTNMKDKTSQGSNTWWLPFRTSDRKATLGGPDPNLRSTGDTWWPRSSYLQPPFEQVDEVVLPLLLEVVVTSVPTYTFVLVIAILEAHLPE